MSELNNAPEAQQEAPEQSMSSLLSGDNIEQADASASDESKEIIANPDATSAEQSEFKLPEGIASNEELLTKFNELSTKYTAPEEYALPEIEGFEFFEEATNEFKSIAKDMGINQEDFGKMVSYYAQVETQRAVTDHQNRENAVYEAFGGRDKAVKEIPVISARAKSVLGADGMSVFQDAASGSITSAASAIKLTQMLINKLQGEPTTPVNTQAQPSMTREDLREMMRDPRYKTNPEYRAKVDEGYNRLFG